MDDRGLTWTAGTTTADDLDESDPHAGDDADWGDDELAAIAVPPEPSPLLLWRGLLLGLLLSATAWLVLAVAAFGLYELVSR